MLKKLFNIMKKNVKEEKKESKEIGLGISELEQESENKVLENETILNEKEEVENDKVGGEKIDCRPYISIDDVNIKDVNFESTVCLYNVEERYSKKENELEEKTQCTHIELSEEDREYIKDIKIKRGKSIRAIDVYSEEIKEFKTHVECSKKLKIPIDYIKENLKYGYTDYLGQAINYLSEELNLDIGGESSYLESNKMPIELFNNLNNKIFTTKMPEHKREEILCSEKIEPVKMHYKFECIDEEYDEYFTKYKSIIKRGGKKRVELVDKKGEVIKRFKSLDDCANYLNKEKNEVVYMLKHKDTKIGRYEIRYSLKGL